VQGLNDIVEVRANGTTINIYINGALAMTETAVTFNGTAIRHGVRVLMAASATTVDFDNWAHTALAA
jgi:hypothetical protein